MPFKYTNYFFVSKYSSAEASHYPLERWPFLKSKRHIDFWNSFRIFGLHSNIKTSLYYRKKVFRANIF